MKPLLTFFISLFLLSCFFSEPLQAGNKKEEARKQIESLKEKIESAGESGNLQKAIDHAEQSLEIALKDLGEDSLETAQVMTNVANLYMYAGHAVNAESIYKKVILVETKHYKKKDLRLADSFYNLAMAYAVQKRYDQAREMLDKAYQIRVEKLGEKHPDSQKIRTALKEIWQDVPSLQEKRL